MSAMVHKAGTALQTGATASPVTGTHTQSDTKSAAGELKFYRAADGSDLSAYVADPHNELTFEALIAADVGDKELGDIVTVGTVKYMVTRWDVTESNDDVKKVSIGLRTTTLSAPTTGNT